MLQAAGDNAGRSCASLEVALTTKPWREQFRCVAVGGPLPPAVNPQLLLEQSLSSEGDSERILTDPPAFGPQTVSSKQPKTWQKCEAAAEESGRHREARDPSRPVSADSC
ncbi:uncharacterized protein FYW61_007161 isoform 2-T2 [Anableps anableps]